MLALVTKIMTVIIIENSKVSLKGKALTIVVVLLRKDKNRKSEESTILLF